MTPVAAMFVGNIVIFDVNLKRERLFLLSRYSLSLEFEKVKLKCLK